MTLAAKFIVEEDAEAMQKELREAFRLYDKEGEDHTLTALRRLLIVSICPNLKSYWHLPV